MPETIRVLRVIEYVGDRETVERTLSTGHVPANGQHAIQGMTIRSAIVGTFPEILKDATE